MLSTGVFGDCKEELSLWLSTASAEHHMDTSPATDGKENLNLVGQCVETVLRKPHVYTERVLQKVEEAADIAARLREKGMEGVEMPSDGSPPRMGGKYL